jgi:hypothetical protein
MVDELAGCQLRGPLVAGVEKVGGRQVGAGAREEQQIRAGAAERQKSRQVNTQAGKGTKEPQDLHSWPGFEQTLDQAEGAGREAELRAHCLLFRSFTRQYACLPLVRCPACP